MNLLECYRCTFNFNSSLLDISESVARHAVKMIFFRWLSFNIYWESNKQSKNGKKKSTTDVLKVDVIQLIYLQEVSQQNFWVKILPEEARLV